MAKSRILTHPRFSGAAKWDSARRELSAVRDITHVLLNADAPEEVLQFSLDRVSPLIGASFASVYLIEGVSELMRLGAAYNWPEQHRPWLGGMRVRLGFGPSGEAASERRIIEVPDVAADKELEDWAEVARELGFRSLVALPLQSTAGVLGTLTFYFREQGLPDDDRRNLMRVVADQLAMAAEKSRLNEELRRASAALSDARDELEHQYRRVLEAGRARDTFLGAVSAGLHQPLLQLSGLVHDMRVAGAQESPAAALATKAAALVTQLKEMSEDLVEFSRIVGGGEAGDVAMDEFSPASCVTAALAIAGAPPAGLVVEVAEFPEQTPTATSDRQKYSRLLVTLFRHVYRSVPSGTMSISVDCTASHARFTFRCSVDAQPTGTEEGGIWGDSVAVQLAVELAQVLGGRLDCTVEEQLSVGGGSGETVKTNDQRRTEVCVVELPLELEYGSARV